MTNESDTRVLLIGYGNPGRRDDGLGPALAAALERRRIPGLETDADYQLTVEDSHAASRCDFLIFADAAVSGPEPFVLRPQPATTAAPGLSSHGVEPGEVVALADQLFGAAPRAFTLGIRGYVFDEFAEGLTEKAERNLAAAADYMERTVRQGLVATEFQASATPQLQK